MRLVGTLVTILLSSLFVEGAQLPGACNGTAWSPEQDDDSVVVSAKESGERYRLRCVLGCQFVVIDTEGTAQGGEDQCVRGCLHHATNISLSVTSCHRFCQNEYSQSSLCQAGCNVSSQFIYTRSQSNDVSETPTCVLSGGRGLQAEERAFIPENEMCEVSVCNSNGSISSFQLSCTALSSSCTVGSEETATHLAECCGFCGEIPINPTSPLKYAVTDGTLLLTLPPANSPFMTAAQSVLVRIRASGQDSDITLIPVLNTSDTTLSVNVTHPVCTALSMDYVAVNLRGVSSRSPPIRWTVAPGAITDLSVSFSEDLSLLQHANLQLQWKAPPLANLLTGYQVTMKTTTAEDFCQNRTTYSTVLRESAASLSLSVNNTDDQQLPLFGCDYTIKITTFPGVVTTTKDVRIRYRAVDRVPLIVTCTPFYRPENISYDIIVSWKLDPLAAAAVSFYEIRLFSSALLNQLEDSEQVNNRTMSHTFTGAGVLTQGGYAATLKVTSDRRFFWRKPILPLNDRNSCLRVATPGHPPSTITDVLITDLTHFTSGRSLILSLSISWKGPLYPNGEMREFELRVTRCNELERFVFEAKAINPTLEKFSFNRKVIPLRVPVDLCLQIRSRNQYALSNWSLPLPLMIDVTASNSTESSDAPSSSQLPGFAVALISVAVVFVILSLCILLTVLFVCLKKHRAVKFDPLFISMSPAHKSSFKRNMSLRDSIISQRSQILHTITPINPDGTQVAQQSNIFSVVNPMTSIKMDHWEIPYEELKVFDSQPLGRGAFGEVLKGHINNQVVKPLSSGAKQPPKFSLTCIVAVKRLKENASGSEKLSFLKEIELMKKVSESESEYSQFVVNMVGCVTIREPFLLVLEYVKHGDLLKYLRAMKCKLRNMERPVPYLEPAGTYSKLNPKDTYEDLELLEQKDLLMFSRQIAAGMEHLSNLQIIHRDLACRNILVGDSKTLKISDFGMSRHVPNEEAYVLTSHGQIPLRWMAMESILRREFTTASDVWSFGIVLWEISTMGDLPYPVYTNKDVVELLKRGYRIPKPDKCSSEIYEVMRHCWCEDPMARPSFSELRQRFDHFLSAYKQDEHPYIEIPDQPYQFDRLAPETGQVGRNSFLDSRDSPLNIEQLVDPGEDASKKDRKRGPNRGSMLSGSMELLESPIGSQDLDQDSTSDSPRYTKSPSDSLFTSDLSIEGDLLQQLDRRLSYISVNRLQVQMALAKRKEKTRKKPEHNRTKSETMASPEDEEAVDLNQDVCMGGSEDDVIEQLDGKEKPFGRRESLLERKKRDYFKFTLVPTCGVQFSEESDKSQGSREVLI